jgi:hypothetical protein
MPSYLVETYLARGQACDRAACDRRARSAAEELMLCSTPVRFERSIYIPEDEICFYVFAAPSGRDAVLAAQRAELDPIRVVEAVSSEMEELSTKSSLTTTHECREPSFQIDEKKEEG